MCEGKQTSKVNTMEASQGEQASNEEKVSNEQVIRESEGTNKEDKLEEEPERFPWWCGGGIRPQNGTDLGVWEESLEDRANVLSLWWMSYLNPLLSLGSRKVLDAKDVGVPSKQDRAEKAYLSAKQAWEEQLVKAIAHNEKVKAKWEHQQKKKTIDSKKVVQNGDGSETTTPPLEGPPDSKLKDPSISASLVVSFGGWRIALAILFQVIAALLSFVPVLILNDLVGYFEWYNATDVDREPYNYMAPPWVEVLGLGIVPFVVSILQTRHNTIMAHCGVFVRTAVSTLLYRKALNVSAAGRAMTSTGQVVNMMSNGRSYLHQMKLI